MPGVTLPGGSQMAVEVREQPAVLRASAKHNRADIESLSAGMPGRVRLLGHGSSAHAARFGAQVLEARRGIQADVVPPPDATGGSAVYRPGELVIALSQSGETPTLVSAVRRAVAAGARVVAITNVPGSELSRVADLTLGCEAGVERAVPATKSFLSQAALLLALAAGVGSMNAVAAAIDELLADPPADVVRPRLIAGARSAAPIAGEVALKFAEAAGLSVAAVDAAEALHGATAAGEEVLVLAPAMDGNVQRLAALPRVRVLLPGDALPSTGDPDADALVLAVVGQLLALNLAVDKDRDPDRPPGLRKVTRSY